MNRFNQEKRGRGTGLTPVFSGVRIKSEGRKGKDLIGANSENAVSPVPRPLACPAEERADLERYLATNPGKTARDFKGKDFVPFDPTYSAPGERDWRTLDRAFVRSIATTQPARFLRKSIRQAAAHDPGLIWDEASRSYCRHFDGPSRPTTAVGKSAVREGVSKVTDPTFSRPAAAINLNANHIFDPPRGRAARARRNRGDT